MNANQNPSRLTTEERSKLRGEFVAYMDMHPAVPQNASPSPYFSFATLRLPVTYALLAVFLLGGTAYASERSLPTDFLYDVKTEVLESAVLGSVSFSPPLKAKVAAALIERRFDEAEILSNSNRLGEEESNELATKLEDHVAVIAAAALESDANETEEMIDISLEVEATLAVRAEDLSESDETSAAISVLSTEEMPETPLSAKLRALSAVADSITASVEERFVDSLADGSEYVEARASEVSAVVESSALQEVPVETAFQAKVATSTEAYELFTAGKSAQTRGDIDSALASFREAEQVVIESRLQLESSER